MTISDHHVATLRALLNRNIDEYTQLFNELIDEESKRNYFHLLTGAFFEAVKLQFNKKNRDDIVEWVADVRARVDNSHQIDPNVAERMILWVFGKSSIDDLAFDLGTSHQAMIIGLILDERETDDEGLDSFLAKARDFTEEMIAHGDSRDRR